MPKLTAFVARSFDEADEGKIQPIIDFLATFNKLGLVYVTAERAEPELVHKKVRRLIDESELFIGIFTKRIPICLSAEDPLSRSDTQNSGATPNRWCPPLWILQESGYALAKGKKLIMFKEADVELPALQGDLEYIPYDPSNPASALTKGNEMIVPIIADSAGTVVETVVREMPTSEPEDVSPPQPQVAEKMEDEASLGKLFFDLTAAIGACDWAKGEQTLQAALEALQKEGKQDRWIFWRGYYLKGQCLAGEDQAFHKLKALTAENSSEPIIWSHLGDCYSEYRDYIRAADSYQHAARLSKAPQSLDYTVEAARSLRIGKRQDESEQLLLRLLTESTLQSFADMRFKVLRELYETVKQSGDAIRASAIGELALQENPGHRDLRFSLAFSYSEGGNPELSVYHYKLAASSDTDITFNNLGVEYSNCELPILSVDCYKKAIQMGNTLAASNLAYVYLNAGAAEEAEKVLRDTLQKEDCAAQVPRALATVAERRADERKREEEALERAERRHNFLVALGAGFLSSETVAFSEGIWRFPFAEISLTLNDGRLGGETTVEDSDAVNALAGILGGVRAPGKERKQSRRFRLHGEVTGRACHFYVEKEIIADGSKMGLQPDLSITEGFMVFSADNTSAEAAEVKGGEFQKPYHVTRV